MDAKIPHHLRRCALALCAAVMPMFAQGQEFPTKPIRIVVGFPPGGIMDVYARVLGNMLQAKLKSPVVIDNRPGAGAIVGTNEVVKSAPDGYTLTHIAPSTVTPVFVKDPPFDVLKALQPIASVWVGPFALAINSNVPATNMKEFVEYAKANPGKVNYGSNGPSALPMGLLAGVAGLQMQRIDYKGGSQVQTALLINEIQANWTNLQPIISYLEGGKIRVIGVTGSQRLSRIPNVATTAEQGFGNVNLQVNGVIMAPAGVPAPVAQKLNAAFREIMATPEMEKLFADNGRAVNVSLAELTKILHEEVAAWEAAAKIAGYKPQ